MKHFKNFKRYEPENNPSLANGMKVLYEKDENDICWYDLRNQFSDDTMKIVYDPHTYKITSFSTDKTIIFPHGNNVVEIELDKIPKEMDIFLWKLNPETMEPYLCFNEIKNKNKLKQSALIRKAQTILGVLEYVEDKTSSELEEYSKLKKFCVDCYRTDISILDPVWPEWTL